MGDAQTTLTVPLERVTGVLMADGWHPVQLGSCRTGIGMLNDVPPVAAQASRYIVFHEDARDVFAPISAVLAFRL